MKRAGCPAWGSRSSAASTRPEALDMRFHEIRTKSALNRVPAASRLPFAGLSTHIGDAVMPVDTASPAQRTSIST